MKLVIQIPCFNEEEQLPLTLSQLPVKIDGIDEIEVIIIDDGSSDSTVDIARRNGVSHVVHFSKNRGLAQGFMAGIDAAIRLGADIIVNTDADNQYCSDDIPLLIQPILEGKADIVIGDRQVETIPHFSFLKKRLQKVGSRVVSKMAGTHVTDTTSGFRALSKEAAMKLNVVSGFTYTLETILQAGHQKIAIESVPIRTNPMTRESRLFKGMFEYLSKSFKTLFYVFTLYNPLTIFSIFAFIFILAGSAIGIRFLVKFFMGEGQGHVQSLILAGTFVGVGFYTGLTGIVAWLIGANRKMIQESLFRLRRIESEILKEKKKDVPGKKSHKKESSLYK